MKAPSGKNKKMLKRVCLGSYMYWVTYLWRQNTDA